MQHGIVSPSRILVAAGPEMVRTGFHLFLDAQPGIRVVGEAADGPGCLEKVRQLCPDVCLVDTPLPGMDDLEVLRTLAGPDVVNPTRVVVVTPFDQDGQDQQDAQDDYVHRALRDGACGLLLKDSDPVLLVEAVRAAARGEALVSPAVTVRLLEQLRNRRPFAADDAPPDSGDPLTEREREVARLVAIGRTNQETGEGLCLSLSTVKTHLANIQDKLGVRNRVEIAAWAWRTGVVRPG